MFLPSRNRSSRFVWIAWHSFKEQTCWEMVCRSSQLRFVRENFFLWHFSIVFYFNICGPRVTSRRTRTLFGSRTPSKEWHSCGKHKMLTGWDFKRFSHRTIYKVHLFTAKCRPKEVCTIQECVYVCCSYSSYICLSGFPKMLVSYQLVPSTAAGTLVLW